MQGIKRKMSDNKEKRREQLIIVTILLILIGLGFLISNPAFTGLVIGNLTNITENITIPEIIENITMIKNITVIENITINDTYIENITENITEVRVNETVVDITNVTVQELNITPVVEDQEEAVIETTIAKVEINKPVKWTKKINASKIKEFKLPEKAFNVKGRNFDAKKKKFDLQNVDDIIEIEYFTEAPTIEEKVIDKYKKQIIVSSDIHYTDVLTYTDITEAEQDSIKVYWLKNNTKELFENVTYIDTNNNTLIDRLEWVIPHLSNQTFEISITILNPVTYLRDYDIWTVIFNTTGEADLIINSTNAYWSELLTDDSDTYDEMSFLDLKCGNISLKNSLRIIAKNGLDYEYKSLQTSDSIKPDKFVIYNYTCDSFGYFSNFMHKAGYATLEFNYDGHIVYAYDPAPNVTAINIYPSAPYSNDSLTCNFTATNSTNNITNWYKNNISDTLLITPFDGGSNSSDTKDYAPFIKTMYVSGATYKDGYGKIDGSYYFDGNDYICTDIDNDDNCDNTEYFNITEDFTVMAWINRSGSGMAIATFEYQKGGFALFPGGAGEVYCRTDDGVTGLTDSYTGYIVNAGEWYHVAIVKSGTSCRIYINGTDRTQTANSHTLAKTKNPLYIGARGDLGGEYFSGHIDDVRIYNRSLSAAEISLYYNETLPGRSAVKLHSDATSEGDEWYCQVTPNSGVSDGTSKNSSIVTIGGTGGGNNAPTFTSDPNIIPSSPSNNHTLTCDYSVNDLDNDPVVNITNWYVNNESITVLLMPFEADGDQNATDYSGSNYSGTVYGVTWNSTGGKIGAAYEFDYTGSEYIDLPDGFHNFTEGLTIELWAYPTSVRNWARFIELANGAANDNILLARDSTSTSLTYEVYNGGSSGGKVTATNAIELNEWQHFVIVQFKNASVRIYKNGTLLTTGSTAMPNNVTRTSNYIGKSNWPDDYYDGIIDEVKIYTRPLSANQIWQNFIESNQSKNSITLVSNETNTSEQWLCSVTLNDGTEDGESKNSSFVTIGSGGNNAPTFTSDPSISPASPTASQNLTCTFTVSDLDNDDVVNITNWYVNNESITVLYMPFESGTTSTFAKDYSGYENNATTSDGTPVYNSTGGVYGGAVAFNGNSYYLIQDTDRELNPRQNFSVSVWIKLKGPSNGGAANIIRKDGVYNFGHNNGNPPVLGGEIWNTTNNICGSWNMGSTTLDYGEWYHVVYIYNSTNLVIYLNGSVEANSNCQGFGLLNSNTISVGIGNRISSQEYFNGTIDELMFFNRTLSQAQINNLYNLQYNKMNGNETNVNEMWNCSVTLDDGTEEGESKVSSSVTIGSGGNNAPTFTSDPSISPASPTTSQNLTCTFTVSDLDNDDVVNITNWFVNNESITILLMPFENGTSSSYSKDYSGHSNDFDSGSGNPTWLSSSGYHGGGIHFDGNDYLYTSGNADEFSGIYNFTVSMWIKVDSFDGYTNIIRKNDVFNFGHDNGNPAKLGGEIWNSTNICGGWGAFGSGPALNTGEWYHVVYQYNGTHMVIYLNGSIYGTPQPCGGPLRSNSNQMSLGGQIGSGDQFNGTIDDLIWFNRTLSLEQINLLFEQGIEKISAEETQVDESWVCGVTLADNSSIGQSKNSSAVTISGISDYYPNVTNVQSTPNIAANGSVVNISATITDDNSVSKAYANIYYPNGTLWKNITLGNIGDLWFGNTSLGGSSLSQDGPWGQYNYTIWANDSINQINNTESGNFIYYPKLNGISVNISIDGSFNDWNSAPVLNDELENIINDFNIVNVSIANNASNLFLRLAINGSINYSDTSRFYSILLSTDDASGSNTSHNSDAILPFKYNYRIDVLNQSSCNVYNYSSSLLDTCTISNDSEQMEISATLSTFNLGTGANINITFETGTGSSSTGSTEDTTNWNKTYTSGGWGWDEARSVVVDNNGNVYVAGFGEDIVSGSSSYDWWIKKFTSSGTEDTSNWNLTFDKDNLGDLVNDIIIDNLGNIYATGRGQQSSVDWWIKKFDSSGNENTTHWNKYFSGPGSQLDEPYAMATDGNNNLYVSGSGTGLVGGDEDWWIKKFNESGDEDTTNWNKTYGGVSTDIAYDVAIDSNDNVYVVGSFYNSETSSLDWWIKKFDSDGNENTTHWNLTYDGPGTHDLAKAIAIDSNDNVYVAGTGTNLVGNTNYDWWIKKFDSNGNEDTTNWNLSFDGKGSADQITDITVDKYDNVYVIGYMGISLSDIDWWIKKFNSSGSEDTTNWNLTFDGTGDNDKPKAIAIDNSTNSIYIVGYGTNISGSNTRYDWWIKKFSAGTERYDLATDYPSFISYTLKGTIANVAPTISTVSILPSTALNSSNLDCNTTITDPDNSTVNVEYWWYNQTTTSQLKFNGNTSVSTGSNVLINRLGSYNTTAGETWNCTIRAYDGSDYSSYNSDTAYINTDLSTFIDDPVITPSSPSAAQNLTCNFNASNSINNITNWFRNNESITVLLMPFEADGDKNGTDYSGRGHQLTVINATWNATGGKIGAAYEFDGIDDFIKATADKLPLGNKSRTVTAWIYDKYTHNTGNNRGSILQWGQGDCNGKMFGVTKWQGNLNFWGGCMDITSSLSWNLNEWTFIAISYNTTHITFYVNNQSETKNETSPNGWPVSWLDTQASDLFFGTHTTDNGATFSGIDWWNGTIDEVRIYNRSLSSQEILNQYYNGYNKLHYKETNLGEDWLCSVALNDGTQEGEWKNSTAITISQSAPQQTTPYITPTYPMYSDDLTCNYNVFDEDSDNTTAIINWYKNNESITILNMPFEADLSDNATDYSGHNHDALIQGAVWNSTGGKIGGAYSFSGSSQYINTTNTPKVPIGDQSYTIEAWIKPDSFGSNYGIVGWGNYGSSNQVNALKLDSNGIVNYWWGTDLYATTNDLSGAWHHVVATYDGTTRTIYLDGEVNASDTPGTNNVPDARHFRIGSTNNGEYFDGYIDEVKIYNISLSAEQVYENFLKGNQSLTVDKIISNETTEGEEWKCEVTPNDGTQDGNPENSSSVEILSCRAPYDDFYINEDTTLCGGSTWNVEDTNTDGVMIINASNIVLDCNSTTMKGVTDSGYGIKNNGYNNITMINCNIQEYDNAVYFYNSSGHNISNNNFINNRIMPSTNTSGDFLNVWGGPTNTDENSGGIYFWFVNDSIVHNNNLTMQQNGLLLFQSHRNNVTNNNASGNYGWGFNLYNSSYNYIHNNTADNVYNKDSSYCINIQENGCDTAGLLILKNSTYNTITYNSLTYGGDGYFEAGTNSVSDYWSNGHNYVAYNDVSNAWHHGIESTFVKSNLFEYNNVSNARRAGMWLGFSQNATVRYNTIYNSSWSGIDNDRGIGNWYLYNNITLSGQKGIYLYHVEYDAANGIKNSSYNIIAYNRIIDNGQEIYLNNDTNSNITSNIIEHTSSTSDAIIISNHAHNTLLFNNSIYDSSSTNRAIYIDNSDNTTIKSTNITTSATPTYVIYTYNSDNNKFYDLDITSSITHFSFATNSNNNRIINVTSADSEITVPSGSDVVVGYYLTINVTNSTGPANLANATGWQANGSEVFSNLTDSSGFITKFELIQFRNVNGNTNYTDYSLYTVNVTHGNYNETQTVNMSTNKILHFNFAYAPTITNMDLYPATVYNSNNLECNATISDQDNATVNIEYWWYNNSVLYKNGNKTGVTVDSNLQIDTIGSGNTTAGDTWNCTIRANDGSEYSDYSSTTKYIYSNKPTHDPPYITPSSPTTENTLTCYGNNTQDTDSSTVINITNWHLNNQSITVLNMPFEGYSVNDYVRDYSGYNNKGNYYNTSWGSTIGRINAAYYYDGNMSYILVNNSDSLETKQNFTIDVWIKLNNSFSPYSSDHDLTILDKGEYRLELNYQTGQLEFILINKTSSSWTQLPELNNQDKSVWGMTEFNNSLYIGTENLTSTEGRVYKYNNGNWEQLPTINNNQNSITVSALQSYNGLLWAGVGSSAADSGLGDIYYYNGTDWTLSFNESELYGSNTYEIVYALGVYNGKLYAGMGYTGAGDGDIWEYNGTDWNITFNSSNVWNKFNGFTVWNGELYAVGDPGGAGNTPVMKFDGSTWTALPDLPGSPVTKSGWSIEVYNNKLYVGLIDSGTSGAGDVYSYDGSSWTKLPEIDVNITNIYDLEVYNGYLWAAARNISSPVSVWYYNGTNWTLSTQLAGYERDYNLQEYQGKLYIGTGNTLGDSDVWVYGESQVINSSKTSWDTGWHHVVAIYNTTDIALYIDNSLDRKVTAQINAVDYDDSDLIIGNSHSNNYFHGVIDELRIFNRSLTTSQINLHYNLNYSQIHNNETNTGEEWICSMTPNDFVSDGITKNSSYVTIQNSAPTQDTPTITPASPNTTSNLTCNWNNVNDADGDAVVNITNWYKNNKSITVLYMPFEGGSNSTYTKDYSGYGNDGSVTNAIWNRTGGRVGGAYVFNESDYIQVAHDPSLAIDNEISIEVWYKPFTNDGDNTILMKGFAGAHDYELWQGSPGSFYFTYVDDQGVTHRYRSSDINVLSATSQWYHLAVTYTYGDNNSVKLYINGTEINGYWSVGNGSMSITPNSNALSIGGRFSNGNINGTLDELKIYNITLSAEQIRQNYLAGLDNHIPNVIVSDETNSNEEWLCSVTPNDGYQDGITTNSSSVTIQELPNNSPNITWVQSGLSDNPTESTITTVWIAFNATDQDGYSDINLSSAKIELSLTGEIQRNSTTCLAIANVSNTRTINCSVNMQYYDKDGAWTINVSVEDNSNELAYNDSETFSYGSLQAVRSNLTGITFGSLNLGDIANATNDPLMLNNTGNQNFTQINLTAYDLVGQSNPAQYIPASNLYVNASLDNFGDQLSNNTMIILTNGTLIRDINGVDKNRYLFFWVNVPGSGLSNQDYSSSNKWQIEVFP